MAAIRQWLASVSDVPRIECEVLLGETLRLSRAQILAYPERELQPAEQSRLDADVAALRRGTPLAYIMGEREFWGLTFEVSPAVLIPRPETELLVELAMTAAPRDAHVLDLGTGSGAIAIALATERPDISVTAVDISPAALALARRNAERHGVSIEFVSSDWFSNLSGRWHVVVANPPYVAPDSPYLADLTAEPRNALVAADHGLADLRRIVADATEHLLEDGQLILEHGYDQAATVRADMQRAGFVDVRSATDLAGIERATLSRRTTHRE